MWDDARQMNAVAITLLVIAVAGLSVAIGLWLVRQPAFDLREVAVTAPLERADGAQLETVIREELSGTFFTLDLDSAQKKLAEMPWVRGVALRRQWPDRLEITVDEHQPYARWNEAALVNPQGEVFAAEWGGALPQFNGPEGRAPEVVDRFRVWGAALAPLDLAISDIRLSARGGWRVKAAGAQGTLTLELPREDADARLTRFVAAHSRTLGALARTGTRVDAVDLRYRNGFAARIPAFRERGAKPGA